jgi:hypothetical protein
MITLFNRKSVYIGFDMAQCSDIRTALANNGISYTVRTKNPMGEWSFGGTRRGRTGSLWQATDFMYEYQVYVHKKDYEQAMWVIQGTYHT